MDPADARRALAYLRLGIGTMWPLPGLGMRIFGLQPKEEPSVRMMARLFAVREVALGASLLQARPSEVDRQVDLGILVDGADLAAIVLAGARRQIGARAVLVGGATAVAALALGLIARGDRA